MSSREARGGGPENPHAGNDRARAGLRLAVDHATAEVVSALHGAGIRPLLLKGPVAASWLYSESPSRRGYSDADLLVPPESFDGAVAVLSRLGYTTIDTVRVRGERVPHASPYERAGSAPIDLHRTLHDLEDVAPEQVWAAAIEDSEHRMVGGVDVDVPGPVFRTLHVVLHVSLEDPATAGAVEDLRRAMERVDAETWRRAGELAQRLGVEKTMAAKLRLMPGGDALAHSIGLAHRPLPARLLTTRQESSPPYVHSLARLADLPGAGLRLRYLRAKAVPPAAFLRQWTPIARRGRVGLAVAYVMRFGWTLLGLPVAPLVWWWARRQARSAAAARASGGSGR